MRSRLDSEALGDWTVVIRIKALEVPAGLLKIRGQKGKVVIRKGTCLNGAILSPECPQRSRLLNGDRWLE